jgi:hypothetical protein
MRHCYLYMNGLAVEELDCVRAAFKERSPALGCFL